MKMERIVKMSPAWDKRHSDPSKNYGIHGVNLRFALVGEKGATQFLVYTNWQLPHVTEELLAKSVNGASYSMLEVRFLPMPADLGYHSRAKTEYGMHSEECDLLGGGCWYDGSGLEAERVFERLVREGDAAVWEELELFYVEQFGELV